MPHTRKQLLILTRHILWRT